MNEPQTERNTFLVFRFSLVFLLAAFVYFISRGLLPVPSADLWWQVATGRYIAQSGHIPVNDIFSFTAQGLPWINHEWLSCLVFSAVYSLGALVGMDLFKILLLSVAFFLIFEAARKRAGNVAAAAVAIFAAFAFSNARLFFDVRPYLFTYVFLAYSLLLFENARREKDDRRLFILVPMVILWANMHAGFLLVYILVFIFGLERLHDRYYEKDPAAMKKTAVTFGALAAGVALASLCNPYFTKIYDFAFSFLRMDVYKHNLNEWASIEIPGHDLVFFIQICLTCVMTLVFHRTFRFSERLIAFFFGAMAIFAIRSEVLFSFACVPLYARAASEVFDRARRLWEKVSTREFPRSFFDNPAVVGAGVTVCLIWFWIFCNTLDFQNLNLQLNYFPPNVVRFFKDNKPPGKMFNPYEWGGYFTFFLYPDKRVFIDGRANTVYPATVYRDYLVTVFGNRGWDENLDKYGISCVVCNKLQAYGNNNHLMFRLARSDRWAAIFEDEAAMVFARRSTENRDIIKASRNGTLKMPRTAFALSAQAERLLRSGKFAEAGEKAEAALQLNHTYIPALDIMAYLFMKIHKYDDAETYYRAVLRFNPNIPGVRLSLGACLRMQQKDGEAARVYREEERLFPNSASARQAAEELENVSK